jgi:rubrerythrin|tara:strand:- start:10875 stop:10982 length:108 start_codon:yes stop_codon:yes gene_type:complete
MKKWVCQSCGEIHEGTEPPEECSFCGAEKKYFKEA